MSRSLPPASGLLSGAIGAVVVAASAALLVLGGGAIVPAFLPLAFSVAACALWLAPLRTVLVLVLPLALVVDNPTARPAGGLWRSPLYGLGAVLYDNLNNVVHVEALRFSGLDAIVAILAALMLLRILYGHSAEVAGPPLPRVAIASCVVAFVAIASMEVWGMVRGGSFNASLWQIRQLLWTPVVALLCMRALRWPVDFERIGRLIVAAACVKVGIGLYFLVAIARPRGITPTYVTSHDDSALFVLALVLCIAHLVHRRGPRAWLLNLTVAPWLLIGIAINHRRLAYVGLVAALLVLYTLLGGRLKWAATRLVLACAPFAVAYLVAGSRLPGRLFEPAAAIMSMLSQHDASSATRDIENYNLLVTLKQAKVVGSGFGHEYVEASKGYAITRAFPLYRYVGHNSVLWLWTIGGLVGFTAVWLMLVTGVFLAVRGYRGAGDARARVAALGALAGMVTYVIQAWGDMGTQSWIGVITLALSLAAAARLATVTGAWPARVGRP